MYIIYALWAMLVTLLELALLALAASFSPTLYAAQASASSKQHVAYRHAYAPLVGVLSAIVFMLVIFRFLHLDTLVFLLGSVVSALILSTAVAVAVSAACIYAGLRLIINRHRPREKRPRRIAGNSGALMGAGFLRTFMSLSGQTGTFLAASVIAATNSSPVVQAAMMSFFLTAASVPFFVVAHLALRLPNGIGTVLATIGRIANHPRYRLYVGIAAVALGVVITLTQVVKVITV